jgi:hypothetical protein
VIQCGQGQVPYSAQFRINCTENSVVHETETTKSDKLLIEEVQRLRAEVMTPLSGTNCF